MGLVAGAIIGSAVIGGGASMIAGGKAAKAAKEAAGVQADAATQAALLQQKRFEDTKAGLQPFVDFGKGQIPNLEGNLSRLNSLLPGGDSPALAAVQHLLGIGPGGQIDPAERQAALEATPGYQFTRDQGLRAVQNGFAAQGLGRSGAAMKGAASFATGLADQTYEQRLQDYVTNWQNQFTNTRSAVDAGYNSVSLGSNAGAQVGTLGTQSANIEGGYKTSGAAATAGGIVGGANAGISGLLGASGAISNALVPAAMFGAGFTPNGWTAPNSGLFSPTFKPAYSNALTPYSAPPPGTFGG